MAVTQVTNRVKVLVSVRPEFVSVVNTVIVYKPVSLYTVVLI
jgi:hypothetical protein